MKNVGDDVYEVSAFVRNTGFLPTCGSERAKELKKARPLTAEIRRGKISGRIRGP